MYKHYEINRMTSKAKRIVSDLFKIYSQEADCLPNEWKLNYEKQKILFLEIELLLITLLV